MDFREGELEELGVRLVDEVTTDVMRPGDTLVVAMKRQITDLDFHHLMDYVRECIPGVKVLVLSETGGIRVFRPDGEGM
jgi:hypothetical protein